MLPARFQGPCPTPVGYLTKQEYTAVAGHAAAQAEIWVLDSNRSHCAHFHRNLTPLGFALSEEITDRATFPGVAACKRQCDDLAHAPLRHKGLY